MKRIKNKSVVAGVLVFAMLIGICNEHTWIQAASNTVSEMNTEENLPDNDTGMEVDETELETEAVPEESLSGGTGSESETQNQTPAAEVDMPDEESQAENQLFENEKGTAAHIIEKMKSQSVLLYGETLTGTQLPVVKKDDGTLTLGTIEKNILYEMNTFEQWIALANYSQQNDLAGYRFCYNLIDGSENLDFTSQTAFTGLGSKEHPFAGEFFSNYAVGNITLKMSRPLFNALSSKATIYNIKIKTSKSTAGLADYLKVEPSKTTVSLDNISIIDSTTEVNKNINHKDGDAGGLFGNVENTTGQTLTITGTNVVVTASVLGGTAGGLIGNLTGNTEICLSGFTLPNYAAGASDSTANAVGGLIGNVTAESGKVQLTLTSDKALTFTRRAKDTGAACQYSGGLFGKIENVDVTINTPLTYQGGCSKDDLYGYNSGSFAGKIENSTITLNAPFVCQNIRMKKPLTTDNYSWEESGIGIFAGVLKNSEIKVGEQFPEDSGSTVTSAVTIENPSLPSDSNNIYNLSDQRSYNYGGLIGYVYNSNLNFTQDHPCKIKSVTTGYTRGNIAGAIGRLEASGKNVTVQYIAVDNTEGSTVPYKTRLVGRSGYTGGLVATASMENGNISIENCMFNGVYYFALDNTATETVMSSGVAYATTKAGSTGKLTIHNFQCYSNLSRIVMEKYQLKTYGGLIGLADTDFEITGQSVIIHTGNKLDYSKQTGFYCNYYGGLVGMIQARSDGGLRKGSVENVCVGKNQVSLVTKAYGGLFGKVEKNCAVSLSGHIWADKSAVSESSSNMTQTAYIYLGLTDDMKLGSIAGEVDNALIYMEPDTDFIPSTSYQCDEIGNYGGVIRNGYYDNNTTQLLIDNFQVTGELNPELKTAGDLLRFAIAMNTEGDFLPRDGGSLNTIDAIRTAEYTLSADKYDLTKSGLMCLARNDKEGMENFPFSGSFTGRTGGKSVIQYNSTSYKQLNIGLFPVVDGGAGGSTFQNLDLRYSLIYKKTIYSEDQTNNEGYQNLKKPASENAGGLAAEAKGTIKVQNVTYTGTITDVENVQYDNVNKLWVKTSDDYLGGIFGTYFGSNGSTLVMDQLETNMSFNYNDATHIMGGVIGYVDLDQVTSNCTVQIGSDTAGAVQLQGNINIQSTVLNSDSVDFSVVRVSSLITMLGNKNKSGSDYTPKCNLTVQGIELQNLSQTDSKSNKTYTEMGGFLGYRWMDVDASLKKINAGTDGDTGTTAVLQAGAAFGGLVHTVVGKMLVDQVNFGTDTSFSLLNIPNLENCGLLVRNGQYLYLDVRDYSVASGITVSGYKGQYFDELVGFTKGGDDERHGGIVSIGYNDSSKYHLGRNDQTYTSYYSGHVVNASGAKLSKNPDTRYYYDLNKLTWTTGSQDYGTLNSADAVLRWHLLHYANKGIRKCFDSGYTSLPKVYTISGSIDLKGYSIYPTPVEEETYSGGTIVFRAKEIIEGEKGTSASNAQLKYPEESDYEHYQMQAGLFDDVLGIKVSNVNLTGTYSLQNNTAGALIAGSIYGKEDGTDPATGKTLYDNRIVSQINHITLNNLWCVSKSSINYDAPIGLMISNISSGAKVEMDRIRMTEYQDAEVSASAKAASALIGNVGGAEATYISMSFQNMDIADAAEGKSSADLKSSTKDEALAKASFIYSYDYEENCNGIYTFTYEDYLYGRCSASNPDNKMVTLGLELGKNESKEGCAKEEYFNVDYYVGEMKSGHTGISFDCTNYLPYVFKTKTILVNPKVGHLTEGCGTYEDPYVISSARQIITLYRYLYDEDKFRETLSNGQWTVNPTGKDDKKCDGSWNATTGHGSTVIYNQDENFPTKKAFSQAYYQITANIDLSAYPEFTGFGRTDQPFVGVFVGKNTQTITMSNVSDTNSVPNYGWIQYAKGCVVKNLILHYTQPVIINNKVSEEDENGNTVLIDEGGNGGGVIATVLGGENIIDNVTVTGTAFQPYNTKAVIGGYVGTVNEGGVILRGMKTANLADFSVSLPSGTVDQYYYTCGMIGRVFDGYVVYDDSTKGSETALFKDVSDVYSSKQGLPQSRSYDIVNGAYLKSGGDSKITWKEAETSYEIADAKQFQVLSMALNAGVLNYDSSNNLYVGYNSSSRQRRGNYEYVGSVASSGESKEAYESVIRIDNRNNAGTITYQSFLSEYFDWSTMVDGDGNSKDLNPADKVTSFNLTGTSYDMSVFDSAFRGLGARYFFDENANQPNVFHGNLIGPDTSATINLNMYVDGIQNVSDVALLNNINTTNKTLTIQNIVLSGLVCNKSDVGDDVSFLVGENKNAAGFVSDVKNVTLSFQNVKLNGLEVLSQNYAGGMAAYSDSKITFTNCGITGAEGDTTWISGCADVGGFIGYESKASDVSGISELQYLKVESLGMKKDSTCAGRNAGGIFGTIRDSFTIDGDKDGTTSRTCGNLTVKTTGDRRNVQIGGLVGSASTSAKRYQINDITLTNLNVRNEFSGAYEACRGEYYDVIGTGGIIGAVSGTTTMTNVTVGSTDPNEHVEIINTSTTIPSHYCYATGGLVGRHLSTASMTLTNCQVLGAKKDGSYTTTIVGRGSNVGGITGNSNSLTCEDLVIRGVGIDGARYVGGITGWVETSKTLTIHNITLEDVGISLSGTTKLARGDIGGLIGHGDSGDAIDLSDLSVKSVTLKSNYGVNVGGLFGYLYAATVNITGTNTINDCFFSGQYVGGIIGKKEVPGGSNRTWDCSNISIENNKIVASREDYVSSNTSCTDAAAGGFAGVIADASSQSRTNVENLIIQNNFISAYGYGNTCFAKLGGISGTIRAEAYFYNVTLKNNYIGMLKMADLGSTESERIAFLASTPIVTTESSIGLRDKLHFVEDSDEDGKCQIESDSESATDIGEEYFYHYSYLLGAVFGIAESDASSTSNSIGTPKVINARIWYTDASYRPLSDVGAAANAKLTSNSAMYANARKRCSIVYDSRMTEAEVPDMKSTYERMGILYESETPYVFNNLETIMNNYTVDKRLSYRLDENYQKGEAIDADISVENHEKLSIANIYKNTYMGEEGYLSPFQANGTKIPMVVYRSAENGTLDQVLQTYINILTNNSGALNSYVNYSKAGYEYIVNVDTVAASFRGNTITIDDTAEPSVLCNTVTENGIKKYQFYSGEGDNLTSATEGTFTFVQIEFGCKKSATVGSQKWTIVIPVYVERRLQIHSNMKMLEGIQYNTSTIKSNGLNVLNGAADPKAMTLTRGSSYSIYTEYIYADTDNFTSAKIPKSLCIDTDGEIYFSPGTKMTLIALDEKSKAYYYQVTEENAWSKKIDFTDFRDLYGNPYQIKDIITDVVTEMDYTDLCGKEYPGFTKMERYVLLVDTSDVTESRSNGLYRMHVSPVNLETTDPGLYSRTDYQEHCYEYINEIDGVTYKINTDSGIDGNPNTYLEPASQITQDGKVKVHLQYDITASPTYWGSERQAEKTYMDVGFYLAVKQDDTLIKVPLPERTTIILDSENNISLPASGQTIAYYYQSLRKAKNTTTDAVCINDLTENMSDRIEISFDFSNADMSVLDAYSDSQFYVIAELAVTNEMDMPAGGEVKDSYDMPVGAQMKTDMGFALDVSDMATLGMNQYSPERSDSGVVPYTASIAFPSSGLTNPDSKYYTVIYQIEEKTSQKDGTTGKPTYQIYKGNDVSLYLGTFDTDEAKDAVSDTTNSVTSGKGLVAVTYQFSSDNIAQGAKLTDGMNVSESESNLTKGVIQTNCTLVANCKGLNMTNYRVRAYLIVSDEPPLPGAEPVTDKGCLKQQLLRKGNWSNISNNILNADLKNDFFVFTVAKIKTSM